MEENMEEVVDQLRKEVEDVTAGQVSDTSSLNGNKMFDATGAAIAEKEKRQAANDQAVARRVEKELQECTFKPALSRKSLDLLAQSKRERPALHERGSTRSRTAGAEANASPAIDERSRKLASAKARSGPVFERLMEAGAEMRKKQESSKQEREKLENEAYTGKPQLNKRSEELLKKKYGESGTSTIERLTERDIERRRENLKRIEMERDAKMRESTEPKTFINETSKKLADRMEAAGRTSKARLYGDSDAVNTSLSPPAPKPEAAKTPVSRPRPTTAPASGRSRPSASPKTPSARHLGAEAAVPAELKAISEVEALRAEFARLLGQKDAAIKELQEEVAAAAAASSVTASEPGGAGEELEQQLQKLREENSALRAEVEEAKKASEQVSALSAEAEEGRKAKEQAAELKMEAEEGKKAKAELEALRTEAEALRKQQQQSQALAAKEKELAALLETKAKEMEELKAKHSKEVDGIMAKSSELIKMNATLKSKVEEFQKKEASQAEANSGD